MIFFVSARENAVHFFCQIFWEGGELMFEIFLPRRVKSVIFLIFVASLFRAFFSKQGEMLSIFLYRNIFWADLMIVIFLPRMVNYVIFLL